MHYTTSSTLIIIAIIILAIALIAAIVAYKLIKAPGIISNNTSGDLNSIQGTLLFFIIIDSIFLLVAMYGLAKIRTSNLGGIWLFILGLIIAIVVLILGIIAINKVDPAAYPWVLRSLTINTIFIILAFFLLVLSVFTKPRCASGNNIKKIYQSMKSKAENCRPINCEPQPCPPIQQINCAPPQVVNCAPPPKIIECPPIQQQCAPLPANCNGLNYTGPNGQIANYVQNPYRPLQ